MSGNIGCFFSKGKLFAVFCMFPLTYLSVLIQVLFPALKVEMFATVLAILILIITVQRPDENINTYFGIRNYQAYWNDLRRAFYNEKMMDILHDYDVSPEKINLEITETAMESSFDIMMENLNALSKEGITFSLDDYGTGFSNIQRIITMPLSIVKLDKSFIDEIHNPDYQVIVTNTIKMLKDLNLKILSEGVEVENQLGFLNEQKCDYK